MAVNVLYRTTAIATGGRAGTVRSADNQFEARLAMPPELGGAGGAGVNPEVLFASGYAACFASALQFVAGQKGVTLSDVKVQSDVGIGPRDEGGFGLTVALTVNAAGASQGSLEELVAEAHQGCPYSNATRNNIDVRITTNAM